VNRLAWSGTAGSLLFVLGGCPAPATDPPPPPQKLEILPAPPRALGAHAAGTDAAPKPEISPPGDSEAAPSPTPLPTDAAPEGSAPDPDPAPPPSPADAGTAL